MSAYSKFTLPTTLIRGDQLEIPVTVVNNHAKPLTLTLVVNEYVFKPTLTTVNTFSRPLHLSPKSQKEVPYSLNTGTDKHMSQDILRVEAQLLVKGELIDKVVNNAKMLSNGFDDTL